MPTLLRRQALGTMTAAGAMLAVGQPALASASSTPADAAELERQWGELERLADDRGPIRDRSQLKRAFP